MKQITAIQSTTQEGLGKPVDMPEVASRGDPLVGSEVAVLVEEAEH